MLGLALAALALPPPPYRFANARLLYQPKWVRAEQARRVTPEGLSLLSAFGWTLGGVFVAQWDESPIGPYTEVAVLSGLVWRAGSLGAWASHIVVTSDEAVSAGRELWGLPAVKGTVLLNPESPLEISPGGSTSSGPAICPERIMFNFESGSRVLVEGWGSTRDEEEATPFPIFSVTLPSLSGGLPPSGSILRYPLTVSGARRIRLRPAAKTTWTRGICAAAIAGVLDGPSACPCLELHGVDVLAGTAVPIEERSSVASIAGSADRGLLGLSESRVLNDMEGEKGRTRGSSFGRGSDSERPGVIMGASWDPLPLEQEPGRRISPFLLVIDSGLLIMYGLIWAIVGLFTSGEAFELVPVVSAVRDAKEIALTLDTCASHVIAWGVAAAATGAIDDDWISIDVDEHGRAFGGVARVLPAWLLSVPIFEFLRSLAALGIGAHDVAQDDWPALAGVTYPGGSIGTLALMLVWRRWLVDSTPR